VNDDGAGATPRTERAEVLSSAETMDILRRDGSLATPASAALSIVPGLARVAAVSSARALSWSLGTGAAAARAVIRRSMSGEPPTAVIQNLAVDLRGAAWRALGVDDRADGHGVPESVAPISATTEDLRTRGEDLLRRSNDVHVTEDTHPAFARILAELTPDEARILRFLYLNGPQPSVDVRTNRPLGIGSELIGGGLNMIAEHAGCRNGERIHQYLTNLSRLGLIEFSKDPVSNPQRYQLLEAQPKVSEAMRKAGRFARSVRRSIHLNAFGEDFCRACLPVHGAPPASQI
jgi:hypothetical protein